MSFMIFIFFKLGRGVPVIVPNDTKRLLKYLASADVRVKAGIQPSIDFLFSNTSKNNIFYTSHLTVSSCFQFKMDNF